MEEERKKRKHSVLTGEVKGRDSRQLDFCSICEALPRVQSF